MKKVLKILLGVTAFLVLLSLFIGEPDEKKDVDQPTEKSAAVESVEDEKTIANPYEGRKGEIFDIVLERIEDNEYANATITEIEINDNAGTDVEGDYILLVRGSFDVKNSKETGNEVMRMYANDLMAHITEKEVNDIVESAIFWRDDYNDRDLKYAYEYKDGAFHITDVMGE